MKLAQQEIKATVTVNTSDLGNKKKDDDALDREVPLRKKGQGSASRVPVQMGSLFEAWHHSFWLWDKNKTFMFQKYLLQLISAKLYLL